MVNQQTLAVIVIPALEYEVIACVKDLLSTTVLEDRYTKIKEWIISTYATSAESRLCQKLKGEGIADRCPSAILLYRLRKLKNGRCNTRFL